MAIYAVADAKFYIGPTIEVDKAELVAGDFAAADAATWVEVDGWETMGSIGDSAETITTQLINRGRDVKIKGTRNAGSMENQFAINRTDPGQIALRAAEKTRDNYQCRIVHTDDSEQLFAGLIMSAAEQGGSANTVQMLSVTVEINSNIVTR